MGFEFYLYGASVQGIQGFIFSTNRLREIIGASEMVEAVCTQKFSAYLGDAYKPEDLIMGAAGNIKYLFRDKALCERVVRDFSREVMRYAPGITLSQAVIGLKEGDVLMEGIDQLERALKAQRNRPSMALLPGCAAIRRVRRTGGVAAYAAEEVAAKLKLTAKEDDEYVDALSYKKLEASGENRLRNKLLEANEKDFPDKFDDLAGASSWLAVIHLDGNGLGQMLLNFKTEQSGKGIEEVKQFLQEFSKGIEACTVAAMKQCIKQIGTQAIRPIVVGGDDVTVVIKAEEALTFTKIFMEAFERETKERFKGVKGMDRGLTTCAGVVYMKKNFPFHYAVNLSEQLCKEAKKFVKARVKDDALPKSAFSFFKLQDSFLEDLKSMRNRGGRVEEYKGANPLNLYYGPYLFEKESGVANFEDLTSQLEILERLSTAESKGVSKLRQLVTEFYKGAERSNFMIERMKTVEKDRDLEAFLNIPTLEDKEYRTNLNDLIQLNSFKKDKR